MKEIEICSLLDLNKTVAKGLFDGKKYPYEVLSGLKEYIGYLGHTLDGNTYDEVYEGVWIAKSAKVDSSVKLCSPMIIDECAEVRFNAFFRGAVIIGKEAVAGNSCEFKNSILFDGAKAPHFNYVGDSILGNLAHMGAGAITSNMKNDKSNVKVCGIETGLRKVGAVIGDNADVGCNSVLNPGTVIGRGSKIYPLSSVRGYVPENSIYKNRDEIVKIR